MSTYTTKQGDMRDTIAIAQYGSISEVDTLMMANTKHIGTYIFPAGVVLDIPEIDTEDEVANATLPPWQLEDDG